MADPGDTAALCNDTKSHIPYEPGQPTDPDIEAGSVIGEEPTIQQGEDLPEGEEGEGEEGAGHTGDESEEQARKAESKIPFIYMIVEPGCTPLSCYSAIITFFIMTCGVLWLLLISPPLNAKAHVTRLPWLENNRHLNHSAATAADAGANTTSLAEDMDLAAPGGSLAYPAEEGPAAESLAAGSKAGSGTALDPSLLDQKGAIVAAALSSRSMVLPVDPDPA